MKLDDKNKTIGKLLVNFANSTTSEKAKKDMDKKIKKLYYKNKNIINISFDNSYEEKREDIKNLLNETINISNLGESKLIGKYIEHYNQSCTSKKILNEKGKIKTKNFLRSLDCVSYDQILTFVIIQFLMKFEVNKQYIRRCQRQECQRYFLSTEKGARTKRCKECRNKSTLSATQQQANYKQKKDRNEVRTRIMNQLNQWREEKSIELQFDDVQYKKLLKNCEWSFEVAFKATKFSLKVKEHILKQLDKGCAVNTIKKEFEDNAELKELLNNSMWTFREAFKFSKPGAEKRKTDKSV